MKKYIWILLLLFTCNLFVQSQSAYNYTDYNNYFNEVKKNKQKKYWKSVFKAYPFSCMSIGGGKSRIFAIDKYNNQYIIEDRPIWTIHQTINIPGKLRGLIGFDWGFAMQGGEFLLKNEIQHNTGWCGITCDRQYVGSGKETDISTIFSWRVGLSFLRYFAVGITIDKYHTEHVEFNTYYCKYHNGYYRISDEHDYTKYKEIGWYINVNIPVSKFFLIHGGYCNSKAMKGFVIGLTGAAPWDPPHR